MTSFAFVVRAWGLAPARPLWQSGQARTPLKFRKGCVRNIRVGWQSDALVTFKRNGLLGNRIKFLICGNCGAILYQCVAEPHRFPQAR